jgi:hypothetical protein
MNTSRARSQSLLTDQDVETIEIELTAEQTLVLAQTAAAVPKTIARESTANLLATGNPPPAATAFVAAAPSAAATPLAATTPLPKQSSKPPRTGKVWLMVRVLIYGGLLTGVVYSYETGEAPAPVAHNTDSKPQEPAPVVSAASVASVASVADNEPVRISNPFDRTEIFEFPAGTSKADARAAVSKLLMERAHDRGPLLAEAPRHHSANAKHETRGSRT